MDKPITRPQGHRTRRLSMVLLALWGVAALTGGVGLLIVMVTWGTADLHPAWAAIFGVSFWTMLLMPVGVAIWVVARFIRQRGRDAVPPAH